MAQDFFGYNRTVGSTDNIASSEFLTMTSAGLGSDLLQEVSIQYGQSIRTLFAVGSTNVYFVGGQSQGSLDFRRLSACNRMFQGLGGKCGKMGDVTLSGGGGGGAACFCAPGGVKITDAHLESVSMNATAGRIEIMEGGRIRFASLLA